MFIIKTLKIVSSTINYWPQYMHHYKNTGIMFYFIPNLNYWPSVIYLKYILVKLIELIVFCISILKWSEYICRTINFKLFLNLLSQSVLHASFIPFKMTTILNTFKFISLYRHKCEKYLIYTYLYCRSRIMV